LGQRRAGLFHGAPVVLNIIVAKYAHCVNQRIISLGLFDRVFKTMTAGVVFAVGHHQDHLFVACSFLQVIERTDYGIVERRAATRVNAFECRFHFIQVVRKIVLGVEVVVVVEIDDETLIRRIRGLHERKRGGIHLRTLVPHAAAIVDNQSEADRHVFLFKDGKFLFDLIFKHAEVFLLQPRNKNATVIQHGRMKDHQVHLGLNPVLALVGCLRRSWRSRRRLRMTRRRNGGLRLLRHCPGGETHTQTHEKKCHDGGCQTAVATE